jgi:hypothetical protein
VTSHAIRHGQPEASRNDAYGHDKYHWPDGLELFIYDDGRVKIGGWDKTVEVIDVSNFRKGASQASAHVIARFRPVPEETE